MSAEVAVLHLGTAGSFGGRARVESLRAIFSQAGASVTDLALRVDHRAAASDLARPGLTAVVAGRTVPESLAWSKTSVSRRLAALRPAVIVCVTARAYHPDLLRGSATVVLDYVDRLSDSYRDRAAIVGRSAQAPAFHVLARASKRFEERPLPAGAIGIAAGWTDANALALRWVPNTLAVEPAVAGRDATYDLLFLGKLSYPPNLEAIHRLGRLWPDVQRRRPGTTLLLAGAQPAPQTRELARDLGWGVAADFDDLADIVPQVRLGVVPLDHASGIQGKVLASAAFGLPQVLSPAAAAGFAPGFPARRADRDDEFVSAVAELLDDEAERLRLGQAAREHIGSTYSVEHWAPWAAEVLERTTADGAS